MMLLNPEQRKKQSPAPPAFPPLWSLHTFPLLLPGLPLPTRLHTTHLPSVLPPTEEFGFLEGVGCLQCHN